MTEVRPSEPVFVFGSDLAGRHDRESGGVALRFHGAENGTWSGATGNAYVIPYRNKHRQLLPIDVIKNYVDSFLHHAESCAEVRFQIARFACEPDAHTDEAMARLFANASRNCLLPGIWSSILNPKQPARLLVFDPGAQLRDTEWRARLKRYLALNAPLWNVPSVELVSVGNARAIVANDTVAKAFGMKHRIFAPNEAYYGRNAAFAAEYRAVWYATYVLSISDFNQTADPQQIRIMRAAARAGLPVDQLNTAND